MASTCTRLLYHIVFSTKGRKPLIADAWRERLHAYIGGTVDGLNGVPRGVGGVADHVHLLVALRPTHCVADFVREVKKASSVWVASEMRLAQFRWQEGYAAFTVSASAEESVRRYIASQEEHHRRRTFREELEEILRKSGVVYDSQYLE